ncbi:hypothetical protein CAI21_20845 [Alkalilimnicola ehrlichii]|uniref:Lipocalin-like domain-containing protein n=1 Tax=Alkalilimnicola ehrlichii TaxID=351052 RepID=A0A3E0WMW4_9GAMM|nr:hypothetical protein [Alkalilimnicola ehrlichii]RFA24663.1 hypothetical protein CAI21_20845 [Alkalilimnicola ehrlichii]RFA33759.1 hypothetical protein CAL65_16570 [Alkalilimnicola ehrlichii]
MSVAGTWNLVMDTPFGQQTPTLEINNNGGSYEGALEGPTGRTELEELTVDGDKLSFYSNIKTPMGSFRVSFRGGIEGDAISGTFKSMAGVNEFSGTRA